MPAVTTFSDDNLALYVQNNIVMDVCDVRIN